MVRRKLTREQETEIARLYETGLSTRKIAPMFGVSYTLIQKTIKRTGTAMRSEGWSSDHEYKRVRIPESDKVEARRLYAQGLSMGEISQIVGWSASALSRAIRADGTITRASEWGRVDDLAGLLVDAASSEMTGVELADKYGVSLTTVHRTANKHGIKIERIYSGHSEEAVINSIISSYRTNAIRRGYEYDASREAMIRAFGENCFYCGVPPSNQLYDFIYQGIDRFDNAVGYRDENIVPCCWECNRMKHAIDGPEFLEKVRGIAGRHPA